jgi:hypothetical protein
MQSSLIFLTSINNQVYSDPHDADLFVESSVKRTLAHYAKYCTADNEPQAKVVVTKHATFFVGDPGDATARRVCAIPKESRWQWMFTLAARCVASDMFIFDDCQGCPKEYQTGISTKDKTYEELLILIQTETDRRIINNSRIPIALPADTSLRNDSDIDIEREIKQEYLKKALTLFESSQIKPFSKLLTYPHEYRAYDVRSDHEEMVDALLLTEVAL